MSIGRESGQLVILASPVEILEVLVKLTVALVFLAVDEFSSPWISCFLDCQLLLIPYHLKIQDISLIFSLNKRYNCYRKVYQ